MLELCETLGISVNELLTGEELEMEQYSKQAEANLLNAIKQKEESYKRLLRLEIVIGITGTAVFLAVLFVAVLGHAYWGLPLWAMITLSAVAVAMFLAFTLLALRIEQKGATTNAEHAVIGMSRHMVRSSLPRMSIEAG